MVLVVHKSYCFPSLHQLFPDKHQENVEMYSDTKPKDTIAIVQKILEHDSTFPRLTRGEIKELYETVSKNENKSDSKGYATIRSNRLRALMLVLPYNTDNNTEDNFQKLFTRPPVTKVINSYISPQPQIFYKSDQVPTLKEKREENGKVAITTYKPVVPVRNVHIAFNPTTYHPKTEPNQQTFFYNVKHGKDSGSDENDSPNEPTDPVKLPQRFSSHYNAKHQFFFKQHAQPYTKELQNHDAGNFEKVFQIKHDNFQNFEPYASESAPKPIISISKPQIFDSNLSAKIKPEAYASFKPLNIGEEIRVKPEIEGYLTRFGIVGSRKRKDLGIKELSNILKDTDIHSKKIESPYPYGGSGDEISNNDQLNKLVQNLVELKHIKSNITSNKFIQKNGTSPLRAFTPQKQDLIRDTKPNSEHRTSKSDSIMDTSQFEDQQLVKNKNLQIIQLLKNLEELEKLKINPDVVIKNSDISTERLKDEIDSKKDNNSLSGRGASRDVHLNNNVQLNQADELTTLLDLLQQQHGNSDDITIKRLFEPQNISNEKKLLDFPKLNENLRKTDYLKKNLNNVNSNNRTANKNDQEEFIKRQQGLDRSSNIKLSVSQRSHLNDTVEWYTNYLTQSSNELQRSQKANLSDSKREIPDMEEIVNSPHKNTTFQEVSPLDFVQLEKLLSKVEELERVKIFPHNIMKETELQLNHPKNITLQLNYEAAASTNDGQFIHNERNIGFEQLLPQLLNNVSHPVKNNSLLINNTKQSYFNQTTLDSLNSVESTQFHTNPNKVHQKNISNSNESNDKTAIFSVTTTRSHQTIDQTSNNNIDFSKPVFSATKIIEDAIKRVATEIGVSTEYPHILNNLSKNELQFLDQFGTTNLREFKNSDKSEMGFILADDEHVSNEEEEGGLKRNRRYNNIQSSIGYDEALTIEESSNRNDSKLNVDETKMKIETTTEINTFLTNIPDVATNSTLANLEASFGPEQNDETDFSKKKKNGFYFLFDWNSFLEVGEDKDQVSVKLSPKLGDPRWFLPVETP